MINNKMIVFLSLLSFCLFVSTLALAGQKNRLAEEVEFLKTSTVEPTTPEHTTTPVTTEVPTAAPTSAPTVASTSVANTEVETSTYTGADDSTTVVPVLGEETTTESSETIRNSKLLKLLNDVAQSGVSA